MRVDFMILGAQRAGTTTLYEILKRQPSLVACQPKEPHFFSLAANWKAELESYHHRFAQRPGCRYFEGSTSYAFSPQNRLCVWKDLREYNPRLRFIYLVRNPIERIVSAYMLYYEKGLTDLSLDEAVVSDRMLIDATRYYSQALPYVEAFGRDRVHFIEFEDFVANPAPVMQGLSEFLGVPIQGPFEVHSNASLGGRRQLARYNRPSLALRVMRRHFPRIWRRITDRSARQLKQKPEMDARVREAVLNLLTPDIRALEDLLAKDFSHWFATPRDPGQHAQDVAWRRVG